MGPVARRVRTSTCVVRESAMVPETSSPPTSRYSACESRSCIAYLWLRSCARPHCAPGVSWAQIYGELTPGTRPGCRSSAEDENCLPLGRPSQGRHQNTAMAAQGLRACDGVLPVYLRKIPVKCDWLEKPTA